MNTIQRLLSNTLLAFLSSVIVKAGNALLFILIGRQLGPAASGSFSPVSYTHLDVYKRQA